MQTKHIKYITFFTLIITAIFGNNLIAQPLTAVTPKADATLASSPTLFQWNSKENAINYKFELATDSLFTSIIHQITTTNLQITNPITLSPNNYYWRVIALYTIEPSDTSLVYKFVLYKPFFSSNLKLWLTADTGIIETSGAVSQWNDISGNNFHVTQTINNNSPKLKNDGLGNKPTVQFDGNDWLKADFYTSFPQPETFFIVWKKNEGGGTITLDNYTTPYYTLQSQSSVIQLYSGQYIKYTKPTPFNFILTTAIYNQSNSKILENSELKGSGNTGNNIRNGITVGSSFDNYYGLNGEIAEIIYYNSLISDIDRIKTENYFYAKYAPPVSLGYDIKIPYGFCDTTLHAGIRFTNFLWNTGDTTEYLTINKPGKYWVQVTDIFGFQSSDTVMVYYSEYPQKISDTTVCFNDTATITINIGVPYTFLWSNSETSESFSTATPGNYQLQITDTLGCTYSDTFNLFVDSLALRMSLGEDLSLCVGNTLNYTLTDYTLSNATYLWSTGHTTPTTTVSTPGEYWLQITNPRGCIARDTVDVSIRGEAPVVSFTAPGKCFGETTPFNDQSYTTDGANVVSWQWNFGDGNLATTQNPTHTYSTDGIYPITLTVSTDSNCNNTITIPTVVYSLPKASFVPLEGCSGSPVQFINQSESYDGYTLSTQVWNFGDEQSTTQNTSTLQNPLHTFDTSGTYHIWLKVESNVGCLDSIQKEVHIKASPIANFTISNTCEGETTWFSDSSITESWNTIVARNWEFEDGQTSTQPIINKKYPTAGTYSLRYIIQSINGCIDTIAKEATVHTIPVANFTANSYCANQPVVLQSTSTIQNDTLSYIRWKINNDMAFTHTPVEFLLSDAGTYNVELIVSSAYQCSDTIYKEITIKPIPTAQFTFGYDPNAIGHTIQFYNNSQDANSYQWYFNGNLISTLENPNYNFQSQGQYPIQMVATNPQQCTDTAHATLSIISPVIDLAIANLAVQASGNYMQASANLINMSNRDITDLWLTLQINEQQIRERWTGMLHAGESIPFNFRTQLYLATGEELQYGCVEIATPIGYPEDNMDNNQICITKKQAFSILKVFPNPANEEINLWLTSPIESEATIRILSTKGSQVKTWNKQILQKGINQLKLPLIELSNGLYILEIEFNNKIERMKFNVIR